ncbi:MAG: DUF2339 domain-containing protein, partial [bacterium]
RDWEYFLGAQVGPKVAAGVLILAIAFFVSLAVNRGWLTPASVFGLGLVASLGLVGYGLFRFGEKENFGQVIVAAGLSGLYVDFAAGYAFQHLYSSSVAVLLFALASFAGLGLGFWRSSRAFVLLGLGGGMVAAWMPLQSPNYGAAIGLLALISGP